MHCLYIFSKIEEGDISVKAMKIHQEYTCFIDFDTKQYV